MNLLNIFFNFVFYQLCFCQQIYNATELMYALLVHRHGDRTPTMYRAQFSNNPTKLKELVQPIGYGEVTSAGLQRSYKLGEFIRQRYGSLISPRYDRKEILIQAIEFTRVQMSAQAVMAAVFRPAADALWNPDIKWIPTPYRVLPKNQDYNMGSFSCSKYGDINTKLLNEDYAEMHEYNDVLEILAQVGHNFTSTPLKLILAYDTFVAQLGLGLPLDPRIEQIYPRLKTAAEVAFGIAYGNDDSTTLLCGRLLSEFFQDVENMMAGKPTLKVKIISGHDINVYSIAAISRARPRLKWPGYGSLFALELRRFTESGKFVVVPIYLPSPEEEVQYLQIENCTGKLCDVDMFKNLTYVYALSKTEWKMRCGVNDAC